MKFGISSLSYQILPNIIFIVSILGVLLIILKNLPEAAQNMSKEQTADEKLMQKGLPAQAISTLKVKTVFFTKKVWNFVLEAKDLKPHAAAGYKMKKIFGGRLSGLRRTQIVVPKTFHEVKSEQYYLDVIKLEPKNLVHYDALGKFYLEQNNINDAKDIYLYLTNHQPGNAEYQAKLALCYYKSKDPAKAAEHYEKSLALDSTQPNRYYNLGISLEASGKIQEAELALAKALELEPSNEKYKQAFTRLNK